MITHILDGNFIESGVFRSVTSRQGTKWSEPVHRNHKEKKQLLTTKRLRFPTMENQRMVDQVVKHAMGIVKTSTQTAIDLTHNQIPVDCLQHRGK
jgi:hypothetical protein